MPSFTVANLKDRAVSAKNSTTERVGNMRDRYSSTSTAKLDLESRVEAQRSAPPPIPAKPPKKPPPPPVHRARASQDVTPQPPPPTVQPRAPPNLPSRSGNGPPPVRHTSRPDIPTISKPPPETPNEAVFDEEDAYEDQEVLVQPSKIDWTNLSPQDKEMFFSWLDEFFAGYLKRTRGGGSEHIAAPTDTLSRPPLPARKSTTDTAPVTKSRFLAPAPAVSAYERPSLPNHAVSAPPPLPGNRPPLVLSTRPSLPEPEADECIRCRDFSAVDAHAAQYPREHVRSIPELAEQLAAPFPALVDKARVLCVWLHHNITYDAAAFLSGNLQPSTPESTLRSGMAVCEGYAGLFASLALRARLECVVVNGHGKGYGYQGLSSGAPLPAYSSNHAWNAVRLDDGEWKLIDSCWAGGALDGAGVFTRRWDPSHFEESNEDFGRRHFPDPSEPWKQYVARPRSWAEYMTLPEGPQLAMDFYTRGYAAHLVRPNTLSIPPGRTEFYLKHKCEHVLEDERECYVPILLCKNANWEAMVFDARNGGWSLTVDLVPGENVRMGIVDTVQGQDARGLTRREYENRAKRQARTFAGLASWNIST